jgi:hypothetical protein
VPGSGIERARALAGPPNDQNARNTLELYAVNHPAPAIGTSPLFFQGNIDDLHHAKILKLIYFYNDDMGIAPGDGLVARKQVVRNFITLF